jgi:hypothetical protein
MTTLAEVNALLAAVNSAYSAELIPAPDDTVDAEIVVKLAGQRTRWAIQFGDAGHYFVNEYDFDATGEVDSCTNHGMFGTLRGAVVGLCLVLSRERPGGP